MNIYKTLNRFLIILGLFTFIPGVATAGPTDLLGVQPGYPNTSFDGALVQSPDVNGASYNSGTGALTITTAPAITVFSPSAQAMNIMPTVVGSMSTPPLVKINATISSAGVLSSGGTFIMTGTVTNSLTSTTYSGTLLQGTIADYGILNVASTDFMDFRVTSVSGSMASLLGSNDLGVTITMEGSTFNGSLSSSFVSAMIKGFVGPISPVTPTAAAGTGTQGYWKNHPEAWPAASLTVGGTTLTKAQAINVLKMPVKGDKTIAMAYQLIAAKLNVLAGNEASCINDTIAAADLWLSNHGGIGASVKNWDGGDVLQSDLEAYNSGKLCAPHRAD